MHTFIFLVLIKNINGGGSWNVTPMPNTDVCVQVLRTIEAHGGRGFGNTGECIEVKTNEPLNSVMETLKEGANKRGNSSRLTQSFHFFMFEPIFSPVNALNQPI